MVVAGRHPLRDDRHEQLADPADRQRTLGDCGVARRSVELAVLAGQRRARDVLRGRADDGAQDQDRGVGQPLAQGVEEAVDGRHERPLAEAVVVDHVDTELEADQVRGEVADVACHVLVDVAVTAQAEVDEVEVVASCDGHRPGLGGSAGLQAVADRAAVMHPPGARADDGRRAGVVGDPHGAQLGEAVVGQPDLDILLALAKAIDGERQRRGILERHALRSAQVQDGAAVDLDPTRGAAVDDDVEDQVGDRTVEDLQPGQVQLELEHVGIGAQLQPHAGGARGDQGQLGIQGLGQGPQAHPADAGAVATRWQAERTGHADRLALEAERDALHLTPSPDGPRAEPSAGLCPHRRAPTRRRTRTSGAACTARVARARRPRAPRR
ncbi:unannotated protein [freshwater metagenome]|uniref:Unannotated protein n=1 Tax=freshwater metagenome TaxID=449393 RepID=A0A6J6NU50_9ZZZZ